MFLRAIRQTLSLAVPLLAIGVSVGCDKGSKTAATPAETSTSASHGASRGTIGISLLTLSNPFFKEMGDAMKAEAEAKGYQVQVVAAELDAPKQRDQVRDFITAGCVAIVLTPADSRAVGTAIHDANDKNIPVFTADIACLDATAKVVSHVATDNRGGGVQAGEAAVAALPNGGKVAILNHPEVESAQLRVSGFEEAVKKGAGISIVSVLPANGQRERGFRAAQDVMQAHPDVDLIFATNDPSALGAVAALEGAGKLSKVKVIGFDGQLEAKIAIRDGKMYADAAQYPDKIGKLTVDQIAKYLAGEKVEPTVLIPTGIYLKADADKDSLPAH